MFENIRNNLDEIERIHTKAREESLTGEEYEFLDYFEMTFAKSMMNELWGSDKIAKIILANKDQKSDLLEQIKAKFYLRI